MVLLLDMLVLVRNGGSIVPKISFVRNGCIIVASEHACVLESGLVVDN